MFELPGVTLVRTILFAVLSLSLVLCSQGQSRAQEAIRLKAAGSLHDVEMEIITQFQRDRGVRVDPIFGPSGMVRERIANGEATDVFLSADMDQPARLAQSQWTNYVVPFTRNSLCLFSRPGVSVTSDTVLERMLDPKLTLATSTPNSDPSGDYTWAAFAKADKIRPGANAALQAKAQKLVGGPQAITIPADRNTADYILNGRTDLFVSYCSGEAAAKSANAGIGVAKFPDVLREDALYGLAVRKGAPAIAFDLALYHLSGAGQQAFAKWGFSTLY